MTTCTSYTAEFTGCKVLITGGLGFIGSTLAQRLADVGAHILLVDSLIPEYGGNLWNIHGIEDRVKVNIVDVREEHGMAHLVQGQDYLFNLAGQTSHMDSMLNPYVDLVIRSDQRNELHKHLRQAGIEATIHYPIPVHLQPAYTDLGLRPGDLPITERSALEVLSLPIFPLMTDEQVDTVCAAIRNFETEYERK
jgi:hypothetical protein